MVEDILARLDEADTPQAMNLPGYRLHPLKGDLKGVLVGHGAGQLARYFPLSGRGCVRRCADRLPLEGDSTMTMKNPPHPGRSIRIACLEPLGLSVTEGAKVLGVTRQTLNNIINGKSGISPEMAIRLSKAFGSTPETWLRMQIAYDLAGARKEESKIRVRRQHVPQEMHMQ